MANKESNDDAIIRRLDLIAHLLLMSMNPAKIASATDQIALLSSHGLSPAEIGKVIGRESNYVSAMMKKRNRSRL